MYVLKCVVAGMIFSLASGISMGQVLPEQKIKMLSPYMDEGVMQDDWLVGKIKRKAAFYRSTNNKEVILSNGLIRRIFSINPACATVAIDNLMTGESELRAVRPEAVITVNGIAYNVGGLNDQPVQNYLSGDFLEKMTPDSSSFHLMDVVSGPTVERFPWKRNDQWSTQKLPWPAPGIRITFSYASPSTASPDVKDVTVKVIYELYDGLPILSKWIEIDNGGAKSIRLNSFKSEILALVETAPKISEGSPREYRVLGMRNTPEKDTQMDAPRDYIDRFTQLFVVTDYAMGGDMEAMKDNPGVRWVFDHPEYRKTGIQYYGQYRPSRLECTPPIGPELDIAAGQQWESFRAFELLRDATDQERRGLAERRFWRAMAPWTQENPVFMHVRSADPIAVKKAIDQCAETGFEMVIMTFGSGFDIENSSAEYIEQMKQLNDYARTKGIALGGYSLLASRKGNPEDLIISQQTGKAATSYRDGAHFGKTPCLATAWGNEYFSKLYRFFSSTGFAVFENDGSYPGDPCASGLHAGHEGFEDSQWKQWEKIDSFYKWCRGKGIYLNVPDWYFLSGSSKTAMGYVETNWSLPRQYQEVIERQNIYDGTWQKTPSMGWMFVPLTQYHGGGEAATIEPLHDHRRHYENRMANLFGAGVQAIFRGPRLYDTDSTRMLVKNMVAFYKEHRNILDADVIHLRRPDGKDWDGLLHVDPQGEKKGLLMLYNPLDTDIIRTIPVPLYYTGLRNKAIFKDSKGKTVRYSIDASGRAFVKIAIPKNGYSWYIIY